MGEYEILLLAKKKINILMIDDHTAIPYSIVISERIDHYKSI